MTVVLWFLFGLGSLAMICRGVMLIPWNCRRFSDLTSSQRTRLWKGLVWILLPFVCIGCFLLRVLL